MQDSARVQRADVEDRARSRIEEETAARVRRHAVEVSGAKRDGFAFAGGGHVGQVGGTHTRLLHALPEQVGSHEILIAPADALHSLRQHARALLARFLHDHDLDGRRADVDSGHQHRFGTRAHAASLAFPASPPC